MLKPPHVRQAIPTVEDLKNREMIEKVIKLSDRSDRTSWKRKQKNIQKLIESVNVIEEEMQTMQASKQPLLDQILEIRNEMVDTCIHPEEFLVVHEGNVKCKFCEKVIRVIE